MRSRRILAAGAVIAYVAALAPAQSMAVERGTAPDARITTIRGACEGTGRFALSVRQATDPGRTDVAASGLPDGGSWTEQDWTRDRDGAGGWGGGISGWTPTDGSYETYSTGEVLTDPSARASIYNDDGSVLCRGRLWPSRQWGLITCAISGRELSVTATHDGTKLNVETRFRTVMAKSAWNVSVSLVSPHSSEGAGAALHASAAGVAHFATSFDYVVNRSITVAFTNANGKGCRATLATRRLTAT